jgi:hypothetical protein
MVFTPVRNEGDGRCAATACDYIIAIIDFIISHYDWLNQTQRLYALRQFFYVSEVLTDAVL